MKRPIFIVVALCAAAFIAPAQDATKVLETFRRNFTIASIDVKIQILRDASKNAYAAELGPLYLQALEFVLENVSLLSTDPRFRQLAEIAADQVAAVGYVPASTALWRLFQDDADTGFRVRSANALGRVAGGDPEAIDRLNRFLEGQNALFATGKGADLQVVPAILRALGRLGDPSSFNAVFAAMVLGYSEETTRIARESLGAIRGDLLGHLTDIVAIGRPMEKLQALRMGVADDRLGDKDKTALAMQALETGLRTATADTAGRAALRDMRVLAAATLRARRWQPASPLLIEHLDAVIAEYDRGQIEKGALLTAIAALGSVGTHEAAVRLTQYLQLLNSYMEKGKGYDEQVVGTLIDGLGQLEDKIAFEDLVYTQYLGYSNSLRTAARAAVDRLRW